MAKKAIVIGSGFGGLSVALFLAKDGWKVQVLEKNSEFGGRARVWKKDGFVFDMGPSWYLMPEVFDRFFEMFGKSRDDYYELMRLDPYYQVFFEGQGKVTIDSDLNKTKKIFDNFEEGGGERLEEYLKQAKYKYDVAMNDFLYKEYRSLFQFFNKKMMTEGLKLDLFSNLDKFVQKYFKDIRARQILEYAMVFLGNSPTNAPALYSIMSHVDLNLGVWYPKGGMGSIVEGMIRLGESMGVEFISSAEVTEILTEKGKVKGVKSAKGEFDADIVLANADYAHVETDLLNDQDTSLKESYWKKKVYAPSMFIAYLGINKRLDSLTHHNLYFSKEWDVHFKKIFDRPEWPDNPCFYLSCPSRTDSLVAPEGKENLFILVPTAVGLDDSNKEEYFDQIINHVETVTGEKFADDLIVRRIFSVSDFESDYHAYKGTALGLSHTLDQTAIFRPPHRSKKVKNLFFSGHYTHPGVGVPMVLISSEVIAGEIKKEFEQE